MPLPAFRRPPEAAVVTARQRLGRLEAPRVAAAAQGWVPPSRPRVVSGWDVAALDAAVPPIVAAAPPDAPPDDEPFLPDDEPFLPIRGGEPPGRPDAAGERAASLSALVRAAVADRLPPALRGGRVALGRSSVLALAAVAMVAAVAGAWIYLRAKPHTVVAPPEVTSSVPQEQVGALGAPGEASGPVVVDVAGKVVRPGLVTLSPGARVGDAIEAAGGALAGTDLSPLNLARRLADGDQVLVGIEPSAGAGGAASGAAGGAATSGPLDLNAATLEQLQQLPGVGPVLAQHILDFRLEHGRFTSVTELREVNGIGESKYAAIKTKVRV